MQAYLLTLLPKIGSDVVAGVCELPNPVTVMIVPGGSALSFRSSSTVMVLSSLTISVDSEIVPRSNRFLLDAVSTLPT